MRSVPPSRYRVTGQAKQWLLAAASAVRRRGSFRLWGSPEPRPLPDSRSKLESLESRVLLSTYYVATSGSDTNTGSLDHPFRTIQRAANLVEPGDTVLIRGGTYRETVKPASSGTRAAPIVFKPYGDENVTVSGADVVSGWSEHDGSVFKARQAWDLGDGDNQVFVDGRMMVEARWPNTSLDLTHPTKAAADRIVPTVRGDDSTAVLYDADLTQPDGYWNGATIHIAPGQGWVMQSGRVISYTRGRLVYAYRQMNEAHETPEDGDKYYLSGRFKALDRSGEWYRDDDGSVYLWTPSSDDPDAHVVESKRREYAFDLRGRSNVTVQGLHLFAATIGTDGDSDSIRLQGLHVEYVSHHALQASGWQRPDATGILLLGTNGVLRDSTIAFSSSHGVTVAGRNNRVENNVIHDIGYGVGDDAGVLIRGSGHDVTRNTIYNAARDGIKSSRASDIRVTYYLIHDVMLQTTDGGAIYTYGTDGRGAEFAYNVIYNVRGGGFGSVGVYLDNFSSNHLVHHNVVWNADHALKMNPTSRYNQIFNNTLMGALSSVATSKSGDMLGSVFRNNIFGKGTKIDPAATKQRNIHSNVDPMFVDAAGHNYQLRSDSPAINAGMEVRAGDLGGTDGFVGGAPDVGAFEYGKPAWKAGAGITPPVRPTPTPEPEPDPTPKPRRSARTKIDAESYNAHNGVRKGRTVIGYLNSGDWARYDGVDFGDGSLTTFKVRLSVADGWQGKRIELRVGSPTGKVIGSLTTLSTGNWDTYREQSVRVSRVTGVQTLYLVFAGGNGVAVIDSFRFS